MSSIIAFAVIGHIINVFYLQNELAMFCDLNTILFLNDHLQGLPFPQIFIVKVSALMEEFNMWKCLGYIIPTYLWKMLSKF